VRRRYQGRSRTGSRLFGAAEAAGFGRTPGQRALRKPYLAAARSLTDETTWQAAYTEGRSKAVESTISRALENTTNLDKGPSPA